MNSVRTDDLVHMIAQTITLTLKWAITPLSDSNICAILHYSHISNDILPLQK